MSESRWKFVEYLKQGRGADFPVGRRSRSPRWPGIWAPTRADIFETLGSLAAFFDEKLGDGRALTE
jgi:hypothetical protein